MKSIEQRVKFLEDMVNLLYGIVVKGKEPPLPEWDAVVDAITRRDWGPYNDFIARGGVVPKGPGEAPRRAYIYKPRKRVEKPPV